VLSSRTERELSGLGLAPKVSIANCKSSLVENGPEIVDTIKDDVGPIVGQQFSESDFCNICNSIIVLLNDSVPWLFRQKGIDPRLQIGKMVICSSEHSFRTLEDVSHGQVRSDERPGVSEGGASFFDHAAAAP
jgi:hypothetical protein